MSSNPLTDPTSLITYRLAHAASSSAKRRSRRKPASGPRAASGVFLSLLFGAALLVGATFTIAMLQP